MVRELTPTFHELDIGSKERIEKMRKQEKSLMLNTWKVGCVDNASIWLAGAEWNFETVFWGES